MLTFARSAAALVVVAMITAFFRQIFVDAKVTTVALTFLLAILGAATGWGMAEAVLMSLAATLAFNFFFLPPFGTLTIEDPQNWMAFFTFLITALVASHLSASAKRKAMEATRRRQEMERLYRLSRELMLADRGNSAGERISWGVVKVFGVAAVAVFDRQADQVYRVGVFDPMVSDSRLRDVALGSGPYQDAATNTSILPLRSGTELIGSITIQDEFVSETALQAIANLAAIDIERALAADAASRLEAARQNEAMKAMLLDALAHEFKTPLTSIKAAASSLSDENPAAQRELVTVIEEETDRLDSLVSETIRMARIEAGDLRLHTEPERVGHLIDTALKNLRTLLEDREIVIDVPEDLPAVIADIELAGLALRQLVTNALKYSNPESPITIRARPEENVVRVGVKDSGPGIARQELSRIFEKYYRIANNGRIPGTGMGLTIAQDIIKAHGGAMRVDSILGSGSEFSFTLQIAGEDRERRQDTSRR
jgi:two-component system, OmpR family, sensor histidine kinase KdpD